MNTNFHYYHQITDWYIGMWGPVPSRPSGRYRGFYPAFLYQLRQKEREAARTRRLRARDGVLATRGGAVERRRKGTGCAVTQAPGRVQCCQAWRYGRRGQRRELPQVRSGGHFCVIGGSLECCCLPEARHAVVQRPPRQRHRDRLHFGVGRDLHYGVGRDLHYGVGRDLHYGVGRDLHYGVGRYLHYGVGRDLHYGVGRY